MNLKIKELLELYKIAVDDEHKAFATHQSRISFLIGLLSTILAGTVVGIFKANQWYEFALLELGPLLVIGISVLGLSVTKQFYERVLDAIIMRAKIEQLLGLTTPLDISKSENSYWEKEPIISQRYISSRTSEKYQSIGSKDNKIEGSEAWAKLRLKEGYNKSTKRLFISGIILGFIVWLLIAGLAYWSTKQHVDVDLQKYGALLQAHLCTLLSKS